MPEIPYEKFTPPTTYPRRRTIASPPFAELVTTSNFSFLRSGSHPEELVATAAHLGYAGLGVADLHTMAGVVRAFQAAEEAELPLRVGTRINIAPSTTTSITIPVVLYPLNREAYGRLTHLLTIGNLRAPHKSSCYLYEADLFAALSGHAVIALHPGMVRDEAPQATDERFFQFLTRLYDAAPERSTLSIAIVRNYSHDTRRRNQAIQQMSSRLRVPLLATNDVHYHHPSRRPLHDVVTCIREGCTLMQAGGRVAANSERYLKSTAEMARLFRDIPDAIRRTLEVAEMTSGFSLRQLQYEYPAEIVPEGETSTSYLRREAYRGAQERYGTHLPEKVTTALDEELALIAELRYEKYFLTCYDIVRFARSRGILCQGRGAAANSTVCFCLGITSVDPLTIDLLFARFVSRERQEPPDIDIDFEHERRQEVIDYLYHRFGRARTALVASVTTYRHRSAVREVGKALGLSEEVVDLLARHIHRWNSCHITDQELREIGLEPTASTIRSTITLANQLLGFPRHLSQHVGGFVISDAPISEFVPLLKTGTVEESELSDGLPRTIIEWDKDDVDYLGMMKIDILALGMLSCIRKALLAINAAQPERPPLTLATVPHEDPAVYEMVSRADTIGVFQIESRAQMSMLPRLKPQTFYDLVIEVAIVRPGPIQGNMVHPYLRRRAGIEAFHFPDERVGAILGKTLGVPIFQEQAMRLAIVLAGFTPDEAEALRRAMAAWKRNKGAIATFKERIIAGMVANGYTAEFGECCVNQIKGFSEYGFPESHAASFALLVYVSAWLKCHYPAYFAMALLNSQPMGFYTPAQIVADLERHGVPVRPVSVTKSSWESTIERDDDGTVTLRLGMHLVNGVGEKEARLIEAARSEAPFTSLRDLWFRAAIARQTMAALAASDAFASLGLERRAARWEVAALPTRPRTIEPRLHQVERRTPLPREDAQQKMFADYHATGLSLRGHPISFLRALLLREGVKTASQLLHERNDGGAPVAVAGLITVRQRPGTAKGTVFLTIEDETGPCNLIVRPDIFERYRRLVIQHVAVLARGTLQWVGSEREVLYVTVHELIGIDHLLARGETELPSKSYSY